MADMYIPPVRHSWPAWLAGSGSTCQGRSCLGRGGEVIGRGHGRRQRMGGQSCEMAGMLGRCDMGPSAPSSSLALVAGRCPLTAGPLVSSSRPWRAASNARAMRGGGRWCAEIVPQQLLLGFSRVPARPLCSLHPRGGLATIFSSGCREMTGCFPRRSHLAVHGRWRNLERGREARCRSWRD